MAASHGVSQSALINPAQDWPYNNDSPLPFFVLNDFDLSNLEPLGCHVDPESLSGLSYQKRLPIWPPGPPSQTEQAITCQSTQSRTTDTKRGEALKQRMSVPEENNNLIRKSECDYPHCQKSFRRAEHLKRHKQTVHGESPNRFTCEFCGNDRFNRQDNLNNHRKLHARPNSRGHGTKFIASAVPIIEQEERNRKRRRAPPKSKTPIRTPVAEKKHDTSC